MTDRVYFPFVCGDAVPRGDDRAPRPSDRAVHVSDVGRVTVSATFSYAELSAFTAQPDGDGDLGLFVPFTSAHGTPDRLTVAFDAVPSPGAVSDGGPAEPFLHLLPLRPGTGHFVLTCPDTGATAYLSPYAFGVTPGGFTANVNPVCTVRDTWATSRLVHAVTSGFGVGTGCDGHDVHNVTALVFYGDDAVTVTGPGAVTSGPVWDDASNPSPAADPHRPLTVVPAWAVYGPTP